MDEYGHPEPDPPPLFPLFADLRDRAVLVAGSGAVARRKIDLLLEAGASVTVVAAVPDPALRRLIAQRRVRWRQGTFDPAWLAGTWLVVAASRDAKVNRAAAEAATSRGIFVNVVDDAGASTFHVPARVRRGLLQVAISTGGAAPVLARRLRERLEAELDESLGALTRLLARERARIRARFPQFGQRRRFFARLLDGDVPRLLRARDDKTARAAFEMVLASGTDAQKSGGVALVGAGPGDPGLLTLKALRALQEADVVLHDRLIGPAILDLARRDAERIDVGKRVGENHDLTQARIHALMLRHSRAGQQVVRLQGGDPLVFGRAGEELGFLRARAIPHQVIPGVTAALACAAAAGVALTDRHLAHGVTLLAAPGATRADLRALGGSGHTLAIYMGVGELPTLVGNLIRAGRAPGTPCAVIENASLPNQRVLTATLAGLPTLARECELRPPALVIVGDVATRGAHAESAERDLDVLAPAVTQAA